MKEAIGHLLNGRHLDKAFHLRAGGVVCEQEPHAVVGDLHRHSPVHCVLVSRGEHSEVPTSSCGRETSGAGHDDHVWFLQVKVSNAPCLFCKVSEPFIDSCALYPAENCYWGPLVFIVATV